MPAYDFARRRRAQRRRPTDRGVWIYLPAEELEAAGRLDDGDPPLYRVWAGRRGSVVVTLYRRKKEPTDAG